MSLLFLSCFVGRRETNRRKKVWIFIANKTRAVSTFLFVFFTIECRETDAIASLVSARGPLSTGWSRLEVSGGTVCRGQREGGGEREREREREREKKKKKKTKEGVKEERGLVTKLM